MIRTQVYLTEQLAQDIKRLATSTQQPQAQVIRDALEQGLQELTAHTSNTAKGLLALAELGRKLNVHGPADLSARLDDYLYGDQD
jgi:predicted transcriptional regulator